MKKFIEMLCLVLVTILIVGLIRACDKNGPGLCLEANDQKTCYKISGDSDE